MPMTFQIPAAAFAPFYDTPVAFHGERAVSPSPTGEPRSGLNAGCARPLDLTVMCCVFEGGFEDPLLDANSDTDRRVVGLSFPISSWRDETPPQGGERVEFEGKPFSVKKVERSLDDYHVTIREGEP